MPIPHPNVQTAGLAGVQQRFAEALMRPQAPVPTDIAGTSNAQLNKRFAVYRNNVHASLAAAISARFPVIERLVGAEFFRAMALVFIERHPPTSPVLAEYGATFAAFLERFEPGQEFPYLADIARLEWARTVAYHAADAEPIAVTALAAVPADALGHARLTLHPAAALIASPYPIVSIWRTNTHDDDVRHIGPEHWGEVALVTRPQLDVLVTELPPASAAFVEALIGGGTLGEATHAATAASDAFDLPVALAAIFSSGAIIGIDLPPTTDTTRSAP
ncbi:MAG: DUF2063 domain-containing protein [Hyphomicrobiaceae bacterium]